MDDLMARLAALNAPTSLPSSASLSKGQINTILANQLGIRSGVHSSDARNAGYSLGATLQPNHMLHGMNASEQQAWSDDLRGSIRKMLDSPNADQRHLILASGVGSHPGAERYSAPNGLQTFPKGQVMGSAIASTPLGGKTEGQLMDWVMGQI